MWREIDTDFNAELNKETLDSPDDIVNANDALRLLLVVYDGRLSYNPNVAATSCQEAVSVGLCLTFADHWKLMENVKLITRWNCIWR